MNKKYLFLGLLAITFWSACKNSLLGDLKANQAPDTHTIIDKIVRSGTNRFPSLVSIRWWGDDPDGYIKGYEYTFDYPISAASKWKAITGNDSTFSLTTPAGIDTADFHFSIRAIDNRGLKDESPASVIYPVRNTIPTVAFKQGVYNPLKTFPVVRLYWEGFDLDGADNISGYEVVWNDTTLAPTALSASVSSAIFEAKNIAAATTNSYIYANSNVTKLTTEVVGMKINANNNLYIRVIDISGAKSNWTASYTFFIKRPSSDKLLVDAYTSPSSSAVQFYNQRMIMQGYSDADTLRLFEKVGGSYSQLSADIATQTKIFSLFKLIVWFGDNTANSLFLAQKSLNTFISNNGKLFMANTMQNLFDPNSTLLGFTPAQNLETYKDSLFLYQIDSLANSNKAGFPTIKNTLFLPVIKPLQLSPNAYSIYTAHLSVKDTKNFPPPPYPLWIGNSTIIAGLKNPVTNAPYFVYSEVELQNLDGLNNIDVMWDYLLQELGY